MSNIHPFPQDRHHDSYDRASEWIARLDRGLSVEERKALRAWMAADAKNAEVLMSMAGIWDKLDTLSRLSDLFPAPAQRRNHLVRYALTAAATVLVAALVGVWSQLDSSPFHLPGDRPEAEIAGTSDGTYETAIGEKSTVMMPDGTLIVLNTNSLLRVEYTPTHRLLTLERGEVNVRVARDESRPLSVVAGDRLFQAVGTAFNVHIIETQKIALVVTEGRVRVGVRNRAPESGERSPPQASAQSSRTVSAGEELILGMAEEEITPVSPEDIEVKLSWRNGNLIFRGESLEEALEEVGRYTSVEFVFVDDDLRRRSVAGLFKAGDVDGLLAALRENFDIVYERVDERTVLLDSE
jgi:transmembrane sensor